MFDIGFAELLIISIVSLLVIGPERLPGAVRTGAAWLRRFKRGYNEIRHEIERELHNDAIMQELRDTRRDMENSMQETRHELENDLRQTREEFERDLEGPARPPAAPLPPAAASDSAQDTPPGASATDEEGEPREKRSEDHS